jgi:hypothetical protein
MHKVDPLAGQVGKFHRVSATAVKPQQKGILFDHFAGAGAQGSVVFQPLALEGRGRCKFKSSQRNHEQQALLVYCFFVASFLAVIPGSFLVRVIYSFILHNTRSFDPKKTLLELGREYFDIPPNQDYSDPASALIGNLERCLYVFAIMFGQPGIITAVVILKAFFGWVEQLGAKATTNGAPSMKAHIAVYYVYIIGNCRPSALVGQNELIA